MSLSIYTGLEKRVSPQRAADLIRYLEGVRSHVYIHSLCRPRDCSCEGDHCPPGGPWRRQKYYFICMCVYICYAPTNGENIPALTHTYMYTRILIDKHRREM